MPMVGMPAAVGRLHAGAGILERDRSRRAGADESATLPDKAAGAACRAAARRRSRAP